MPTFSLYLQLAVMLATGIALGFVARRFGLPRLVGEIVAGLLIGPTVLGTFAPVVHGWLFPQTPVDSARSAVMKTVLIVFLFDVGTHASLSRVRRLGGRIVGTSLGGIVLPFALGAGMVICVPSLWHIVPHTGRISVALIIGTVLSISALPVIAKILLDLDMLKTDIGLIVMSAATIDDLIGWSFFVILLANAGAHGSSPNPVFAIASAIALCIAVTAAGPRMVVAARGWCRSGGDGGDGFLLAVGVVSAFVLGSITEWLGFGAAFGAFLAGVAVAKDDTSETTGDGPCRACSALTFFANEMCAPLYFVSVGLQANFVQYFDLPLVLVVIVIACAGKIGGAWLGGRLTGATHRDSLAIAFGLNARGAMAIIIAATALKAGVIASHVFVAIVLMSLVTSVIGGSAMKRFAGELNTSS